MPIAIVDELASNVLGCAFIHLFTKVKLGTGSGFTKAVIVFVVFFGLVTFYVIKGNKTHFEKLRNLPINEKN